MIDKKLVSIIAAGILGAALIVSPAQAQFGGRGGVHGGGGFARGPAFAGPAMGRPAFAGPAMGRPAFVGPAMGRPAFAGPAMGRPAFAGPAMGRPAFAGPAMGSPAFAQHAFVGRPAFAGHTFVGRPVFARHAFIGHPVFAHRPFVRHAFFRHRHFVHRRVFFAGGPWWSDGWGGYGYYDDGCWQWVPTPSGLAKPGSAATITSFESPALAGLSERESPVS